MSKAIFSYDDIDSMDKETLQGFLGKDASKGLSLAKLKARAKGVHRATYGDNDESADASIPEGDKPVEGSSVVVGDSAITDEAATTALDEERSVEHAPETPERSVKPANAPQNMPAEMMQMFEKMTKRLDKLEQENSDLKSQVNSEIGLDAAARRERKLKTFRVSNHYRDTKAEGKARKDGDYKGPIVVPRTPLNEASSQQRGLKPCAPNGGRYWFHNTEWHESPNTGETRTVTDWNQNVQANPKSTMVLADVHGTPVKKFTDWLPIEDFEKGLPRFVVMAPKPKQMIVEA